MLSTPVTTARGRRGMPAPGTVRLDVLSIETSTPPRHESICGPQRRRDDSETTRIDPPSPSRPPSTSKRNEGSPAPDIRTVVVHVWSSCIALVLKVLLDGRNLPEPLLGGACLEQLYLAGHGGYTYAAGVAAGLPLPGTPACVRHVGAAEIATRHGTSHGSPSSAREGNDQDALEHAAETAGTYNILVLQETKKMYCTRTHFFS